MATKYAFAQGLKELRFHLCQKSDHSAAARQVSRPHSRLGYGLTGIDRQFLLRTYPTMKKHNPHTPILIREALDVQPKVWARYGTLLDGQEMKGGADKEHRVRQGEVGAIERYGNLQAVHE